MTAQIRGVAWQREGTQSINNPHRLWENTVEHSVGITGRVMRVHLMLVVLQTHS